MTRLFIALILACAFCSAPVEAQQPSKADIVKALTVHPRTRSFRGITVEGKGKKGRRASTCIFRSITIPTSLRATRS
jgi:hypothetical protein